MSGISAFILYDLEPRPFFERFLQSQDFTMDELKTFARDLGLRGSRSKRDDVINTIISYLGQISLDTLADRMMPYAVLRQKEWLALQIGEVHKTPTLADPAILATTPGKAEWYGPLSRLNDVATAVWYIGPHFVEHWEKDANGEPTRFDIRWLCFARVEPQNISLHWRGFTCSESPDEINQRSQFPYWEKIPRFFDEIIDITGAKVQAITLHRLFLHDLWEKYRRNPDYHWVHRRVRAKSKIISFNAHVGGVVDLQDPGIMDFVRVIRRSIEQELQETNGLAFPDPGNIDEVILITLLRELGTLSYEFYLNNGGTTLFRAHTYFGNGPNSVDTLVHHYLFTSDQSDLGQLNFYLSICDEPTIMRALNLARFPHLRT